MEYRNIHQFAQALLDDEAFRGLDVFKVDPAERRAKEAHAIDELVNILGRHFKVQPVNIGKTLEQDRFAFHYRLGCQRTQIAKPQNGRTIRDHGDDIALGRIVIGRCRILGDFEAWHRHTW